MTRSTREAQRIATRHAIVEAAIRCLTGDGYTAVTTRRVAELAAVSQPTVMYHFSTREALLDETVTQFALRVADRAWDLVDPDIAARKPTVDDFLQVMWQAIRAPGVGALAQLLTATAAEPGLVAAVRALEVRIQAMFFEAVASFFPGLADDPRLQPLADCLLLVAHGLTMSTPTWGEEVIQQRWDAIRPLLASMTSSLLRSQEGAA